MIFDEVISCLKIELRCYVEKKKKYTNSSYSEKFQIKKNSTLTESLYSFLHNVLAKIKLQYIKTGHIESSLVNSLIQLVQFFVKQIKVILILNVLYHIYDSTQILKNDCLLYITHYKSALMTILSYPELFSFLPKYVLRATILVMINITPEDPVFNLAKALTLSSFFRCLINIIDLTTSFTRSEIVKPILDNISLAFDSFNKNVDLGAWNSNPQSYELLNVLVTFVYRVILLHPTEYASNLVHNPSLWIMLKNIFTYWHQLSETSQSYLLSVYRITRCLFISPLPISKIGGICNNYPFFLSIPGCFYSFLTNSKDALLSKFYSLVNSVLSNDQSNPDDIINFDCCDTLDPQYISFFFGHKHFLIIKLGHILANDILFDYIITPLQESDTNDIDSLCLQSIENLVSFFKNNFEIPNHRIGTLALISRVFELLPDLISSHLTPFISLNCFGTTKITKITCKLLTLLASTLSVFLTDCSWNWITSNLNKNSDSAVLKGSREYQHVRDQYEFHWLALSIVSILQWLVSIDQISLGQSDSFLSLHPYITELSWSSIFFLGFASNHIFWMNFIRYYSKFIYEIRHIKFHSKKINLLLENLFASGLQWLKHFEPLLHFFSTNLSDLTTVNHFFDVSNFLLFSPSVPLLLLTLSAILSKSYLSSITQSNTVVSEIILSQLCYRHMSVSFQKVEMRYIKTIYIQLLIFSIFVMKYTVSSDNKLIDWMHPNGFKKLILLLIDLNIDPICIQNLVYLLFNEGSIEFSDFTFDLPLCYSQKHFFIISTNEDILCSYFSQLLQEYKYTKNHFSFQSTNTHYSYTTYQCLFHLFMVTFKYFQESFKHYQKNEDLNISYTSKCNSFKSTVNQPDYKPCYLSKSFAILLKLIILLIQSSASYDNILFEISSNFDTYNSRILKILNNKKISKISMSYLYLIIVELFFDSIMKNTICLHHNLPDCSYKKIIQYHQPLLSYIYFRDDHNVFKSIIPIIDAVILKFREDDVVNDEIIFTMYEIIKSCIDLLFPLNNCNYQAVTNSALEFYEYNSIRNIQFKPNGENPTVESNLSCTSSITKKRQMKLDKCHSKEKNMQNAIYHSSLSLNNMKTDEFNKNRFQNKTDDEFEDLYTLSPIKKRKVSSTDCLFSVDFFDKSSKTESIPSEFESCWDMLESSPSFEFLKTQKSSNHSLIKPLDSSKNSLLLNYTYLLDMSLLYPIIHSLLNFGLYLARSNDMVKNISDDLEYLFSLFPLSCSFCISQWIIFRVQYLVWHMNTYSSSQNFVKHLIICSRDLFCSQLETYDDLHIYTDIKTLHFSVLNWCVAIDSLIDLSRQQPLKLYKVIDILLLIFSHNESGSTYTCIHLADCFLKSSRKTSFNGYSIFNCLLQHYLLKFIRCLLEEMSQTCIKSFNQIQGLNCLIAMFLKTHENYIYIDHPSDILMDKTSLDHIEKSVDRVSNHFSVPLKSLLSSNNNISRYSQEYISSKPKVSSKITQYLDQSNKTLLATSCIDYSNHTDNEISSIGNFQNINFYNLSIEGVKHSNEKNHNYQCISSSHHKKRYSLDINIEHTNILTQIPIQTNSPYTHLNSLYQSLSDISVKNEFNGKRFNLISFFLLRISESKGHDSSVCEFHCKSILDNNLNENEINIITSLLNVICTHVSPESVFPENETQYIIFEYALLFSRFQLPEIVYILKLMNWENSLNPLIMNIQKNLFSWCPTLSEKNETNPSLLRKPTFLENYHDKNMSISLDSYCFAWTKFYLTGIWRTFVILTHLNLSQQNSYSLFETVTVILGEFFEYYISQANLINHSDCLSWLFWFQSIYHLASALNSIFLSVHQYNSTNLISTGSTINSRYLEYLSYNLFNTIISVKHSIDEMFDAIAIILSSNKSTKIRFPFLEYCLPFFEEFYLKNIDLIIYVTMSHLDLNDPSKFYYLVKKKNLPLSPSCYDRIRAGINAGCILKYQTKHMNNKLESVDSFETSKSTFFEIIDHAQDLRFLILCYCKSLLVSCVESHCIQYLLCYLFDESFYSYYKIDKSYLFFRQILFQSSNFAYIFFSVLSLCDREKSAYHRDFQCFFTDWSLMYAYQLLSASENDIHDASCSIMLFQFLFNYALDLLVSMLMDDEPYKRIHLVHMLVERLIFSVNNLPDYIILSLLSSSNTIKSMKNGFKVPRSLYWVLGDALGQLIYKKNVNLHSKCCSKNLSIKNNFTNLIIYQLFFTKDQPTIHDADSFSYEIDIILNMLITIFLRQCKINKANIAESVHQTNASVDESILSHSGFEIIFFFSIFHFRISQLCFKLYLINLSKIIKCLKLVYSEQIDHITMLPILSTNNIISLFKLIIGQQKTKKLSSVMITLQLNYIYIIFGWLTMLFSNVLNYQQFSDKKIAEIKQLVTQIVAYAASIFIDDFQPVNTVSNVQSYMFLRHHSHIDKETIQRTIELITDSICALDVPLLIESILEFKLGNTGLISCIDKEQISLSINILEASENILKDYPSLIDTTLPLNKRIHLVIPSVLCLYALSRIFFVCSLYIPSSCIICYQACWNQLQVIPDFFSDYNDEFSIIVYELVNCLCPEWSSNIIFYEKNELSTSKGYLPDSTCQFCSNHISSNVKFGYSKESLQPSIVDILNDEKRISDNCNQSRLQFNSGFFIIRFLLRWIDAALPLKGLYSFSFLKLIEYFSSLEYVFMMIFSPIIFLIIIIITSSYNDMWKKCNAETNGLRSSNTEDNSFNFTEFTNYLMEISLLDFSKGDNRLKKCLRIFCLTLSTIHRYTVTVIGHSNFLSHNHDPCKIDSDIEPLEICLTEFWRNLNVTNFSRVCTKVGLPGVSYFFIQHSSYFQRKNKIDWNQFSNENPFCNYSETNTSDSPHPDVIEALTALHSFELLSNDMFYGSLSKWFSRDILSFEAEKFGNHWRKLSLANNYNLSSFHQKSKLFSSPCESKLTSTYNVSQFMRWSQSMGVLPLTSSQCFQYFTSSLKSPLTFENSNKPVSKLDDHSSKYHLNYFNTTSKGSKFSCIHGTDDNNRYREFKAEWMWRMGKWNIHDDYEEQHSSIGENDINSILLIGLNEMNNLCSYRKTNEHIFENLSNHFNDHNECSGGHFITNVTPLTSCIENPCNIMHDYLMQFLKGYSSKLEDPSEIIPYFVSHLMWYSVYKNISVLLECNNAELQYRLNDLASSWTEHLKFLKKNPSLIESFEPLISIRKIICMFYADIEPNFQFVRSLLRYELEACNLLNYQGFHNNAISKILTVIEKIDDSICHDQALKSVKHDDNNLELLQGLKCIAEWKLSYSLWKVGDTQRALNLSTRIGNNLRKLCLTNTTNDFGTGITPGMALSSTGRWIFDSRTNTFNTLEKYFFSPALNSTLEINGNMFSKPSIFVADYFMEEELHWESFFQCHRDYAIVLDEIIQTQDENHYSRDTAILKSFEDSVKIEIKLSENEVLRLQKSENECSDKVMDSLQDHIRELKQIYTDNINKKQKELLHLVQLANKAIQHYGIWLTSTNRRNHQILRASCRFLSLWFQFGQQMNSINDTVYNSFNNLNGFHSLSEHSTLNTNLLSHLKIFVYQIASRLENIDSHQKNQSFQTTLYFLIENLIKLYPFSSIFPLLLIRNANLVPNHQKGYIYDTSKIDGANNVLDKAIQYEGNSESNFLRILVDACNIYSIFFINLGNFKMSSIKHKKYSLSEFKNYTGLLKAIQILPVPSSNVYEFNSIFPNSLKPIVRKSDSVTYDDKVKGLKNDTPNLDSNNEIELLKNYINNKLKIPTIDRYEPGIILASSGITYPKIISFLDTFGHYHKQIVKGGDDTRQDAVMEQLFFILNKVFESKPQTRERGLRIRMYAVIPLSPLVGIVEWVQGTKTLGDILIGTPKDKGAHRKYFPNDISSNTASKLMQEIYRTKKKNNDSNISFEESLVQAFHRICEQFHPVLHLFMMNLFPKQEDWVITSKRYTKSLATTSIIGYLMGIGDRHLNNILLDLSNGELIHIDFGIVLGKGETLPIPETVPFRLTRDFIAGLGCLGLEGHFRMHCEVTMEVLRGIDFLVMSVLEVFLFDPLYQWALNPRKAIQRQISNKKALTKSVIKPDSDQNKFKKQVQQKLLGKAPIDKTSIETSFMLRGKSLSVPSVIDHLFRQSTSPKRLALMYHGWMPWA